MIEDAIQRFERYRRDPVAFLQECAYTRDQVDEDEPIKRFPIQKDYIKLMVRVWQKEKKLLLPKSRRMTASWTYISLALWDILFHPGKDWAFVSKKEDDSAELVSRAEFIFNRIPEDKIPKSLLPKIDGGRMKKSPPALVLDFGNGVPSSIKGYPMGADQLRQFTFSGILGDEAAFWPDAEEFYSGAKPTTDGGGRMVLISSRAPGFFKKLVFDQINADSQNFPEIPPVPTKRPMTGIEIWRNPTNGFLVMDVHYTADEGKRDPEFRKALKATLPLHKYLREYERNWQTFEGMPVYPNFREDIHARPHTIEAELGLPLLLGWDFGLTPACVVAQLSGNKLRILREYVAQNEAIRTFSRKVIQDIRIRFPEWSDAKKDLYSFVDPAGFQRAQTDARTCAQEMAESGIENIQAGPIDWESRRGSVEHFLMYVDKDGAGLEICQADCPLLYEGFKGGYRYPDKMAEVESQKPRPIKDQYSHPHDALQYMAAGALDLKATKIYTIPRPQYGFAPENRHLGEQHATSKRRIFK